MDGAFHSLICYHVGVVVFGHHGIMGVSSRCRGCTVLSSALFPHGAMTHYVYYVGLGHITMCAVNCEVIPQLLSATPPGQSAN